MLESLEAFFSDPDAGGSYAARQARLLAQLNLLHRHHLAQSPAYRQIQALLFADRGQASSLSELAWLPVQAFKRAELRSIESEQVFKVLTSSGTTSQQVSRIYLDQATARAQTRALAQLMIGLLGPKRLPLLLIDQADVLRDRQQFNARGAAILGMLNFGRQPVYLLDRHGRPDWQVLSEFLASHGQAPFLIFGFTSLVWQRLYQAARDQQQRFDLSQGILVHGGGWKKLQDQAVSPEAFRQALGAQLGMSRIHNYYGMVEQTGSIYLECSAGYLHASHFSDVLIRDPLTLKELEPGQVGLIETLSVLPMSYPGHALLTEDLGSLGPGQRCACGQPGSFFRVAGRLPQAELRGCSDAYAQEQAA